jgi:hypothetical protein
MKTHQLFRSGMRFNMLALLNRVGGHRKVTWRFICDCGQMVQRDIYQVQSGRVWNCGCIRRPPAVKHGFARAGKITRTYKIWSGMKERCDNPNKPGFQDYGARGITYDPRWAAFPVFLADMGEAPAGLTLDRIENDGPYSKDNCRWATKRQQANNRRSSVFIEHAGKRQTQKQWADETGIPQMTIRNRLLAGMPMDRVLSRTRLCLKPKS